MIIDTDRLRSDQEYGDEIRHRTQTDHYFLADLVGWTGFIPSIHDPVKRLYFPKNKNLPIDQQHPKKYRIHLDPRHTGKTTFGKVDSLQWIIAFPELITIVNESSTQPLAEAISAQLAKFFWRPSWKAPTALQLVYPELCVTSKEEPAGVWKTPNHSDLEMDPTLAFTSPQTAQSGWHPWILNPDDMVDTTNSGIKASDTSRKKIIESYYTNKNTVRFGGYVNIRGTRYHIQDLYGDLIDKMDPDEWEILIRASMVIKSGKPLLPGDFPDEEDVILNMPEMLSYKKLKSLFYEHYTSFMCQQQNSPTGGAIQIFDENLYRSMEVTPDRVPMMGDTFICWRLPYTGKAFMADYAEGAACRVFGGKVFIVDCWQGTYTPTGMVEKIIRECKKHQTGNLVMEAVPGSHHVQIALKNESYRKNHPIKIQWVEYEEDDNVRRTRLLQIEHMARSGRLLISTTMNKQAECRRQFLYFSMVPQNGIVDAISRLSVKIPSSVMRDEIDEEELELQRRHQIQMRSHMAYGQAASDLAEGQAELERRERIKAEAAEYAWEQTNSFGLPPLPGGLQG